MSGETVQILVAGDYADGASAKLLEIEKHLVESLGINVEFLRGDVHYSRFAEEQAAQNKKLTGWVEDIQRQIGNRMTTTILRLHNGLLGCSRHKLIKAMRKGKNTCTRSTPQMRKMKRNLKRLSSSGPITWGSLGDVGRGNISPIW